ncbi:MAG: hypothetical protein QM811_16205 [Pirellulales bacterium]
MRRRSRDARALRRRRSERRRRHRDPLPAGKSEIIVTTTPRLAGAIHSLTWNGREFIDSADHGRQLQSACAFDDGTPWDNSETFNPTEAGSVRDGAGPTSTSRLLHKVVGKDFLQTTVRMAYWLPPGMTSGGRPAKNTTALSDHLLIKRVTVGDRGRPHVIRYRTTYVVPAGERHTFGQFEALTGYMPFEFRKFYGLKPETGELEELTDGPGEQALPIVFATADGGHAMGAIAEQPSAQGMSRIGYGRFAFETEKVVKWNCAARLRVEKSDPPTTIAPGEYAFTTYVVVGDLETVHKTMRELAQELAAPLSPTPRPNHGNQP